MSMEEAVLALQRFGLGPRRGDVHALAADPRAALLAELDAGDAALVSADLPDTPTIYLGIRHVQMARRAARAQTDEAPAQMMAPAATGDMAASSPASRTIPNLAADYYRSEVDSRAARYLAVPIGFVERLVAFWANHFAVQSAKGQEVRGLAGAFEREAIRPFVLGRFEDMLLAVTRHPAMLLSLDNATSIGPASAAGRRNGKGLNENHAREILELHTVGVDGGYDQQDVTELARILTGWTFVRDIESPNAGRFLFAANRHEPGDRTVMGRTYRADPSDPEKAERQGRDALRDLAAYPQTARHIATKLARHFVDDDPPAELVDGLAEVYLATGGNLKAVSRALIEAPSAWAPGRKFTTPQQFVDALLRAGGATMPPQRLLGLLRSLGQSPWSPPSPQGFHDDAATWLSPEGMTTRLDVADRIAQLAIFEGSPEDLAEQLLGPTLSAETRQAIQRAESGRQALALLFMSPEFQWRRS